MSILQRDFYDRPALAVARDLVGCRLVRSLNGKRMVGLILETEAYQGEDDLGCHASAGRTPRTAVMYGPPGHAYVYFTYGMHWLLNAVTDSEGTPAAVLIRAIHPVQGQNLMAENRPYNAGKSGWTDGPAKLTQALAVDGDLNTVDLCSRANGLWIENGTSVPDDQVERKPRVGLNSVPEPWRSIPWRFLVEKEMFFENS
ncbi:MAG: DNA-3-methyladenine glycosylase [Chloroflexota bacterium]|jgi:DNA-3-methyladenine glycosylase|nr:DNA-3-methyladenine glycosylase [Chloroflexota bacterium]